MNTTKTRPACTSCGEKLDSVSAAARAETCTACSWEAGDLEIFGIILPVREWADTAQEVFHDTPLPVVAPRRTPPALAA